MKNVTTLILFILPFFALGQVFTTSSAGDIESAQSWQNGNLPPFSTIGDNIEIDPSLTLNIKHKLSTTKSEVINRGIVNLNLNDVDSPTIQWRNHGNMKLVGWGATSGRIINEVEGKVLYQWGASYCQHTGCGSENYGIIYVNTCLSNICAIDSTSRFINHESGEIIICAQGYIENYWFLPNAGSIDNVAIINNGTISYDESLTSPVYNEGNDFFNNNPNSMGTFIGNEPVAATGIECLTQLPDLVSSTNDNSFANQLSISPTPSLGNLIIKSSLPFDYINVINYLGQVENKISFVDSQSELYLSSKSGIYIFQFVKDSKILTNRKMVFVSQ